MRVLITGASGGIGAACVQRFLDEGHEVVGFDLLPAAIEHERYRHLIVDVRRPDAFPDDLEPQVIVNVAGTQDSADDIAANLYGTINVTERYAFAGEGLAAKPPEGGRPPGRRRLSNPWSMWGRRVGIRDRSFLPMLPARAALSPTPRTLQIAWRRRPSPIVWTRAASSRRSTVA